MSDLDRLSDSDFVTDSDQYSNLSQIGDFDHTKDFVYDPLPYSPHRKPFRILELHPGTGEEELQCTIKQTFLMITNHLKLFPTHGRTTRTIHLHHPP